MNKNHILLLVMMIILPVINFKIFAQSNMSFEQWKVKQEKHDARLKENQVRGNFQQRVVQVDSITPLPVVTVAKTSQVFGEQLSVNVNTATIQELTAKLDGVGRVKAQAIITYRKNHGDFKRINELLNVKGIGIQTLEKNKDRIVLR